MKLFFIFILTIIIFNLPILLFYKKIVNKVNIFDLPDNERKFHENPIPLLGGIIIFYNLFIIFIININLFDIQFFENSYFSSTRFFISFFLASTFLFMVGIYDDVFKLTPNLKLFLLSLIILGSVLVDPQILISKVNFSFTSKEFLLKDFSIFFTILSFLLFINAFNMFDGINMQSGFYALTIFLIFIIKGFMPIVFITLSIGICIFLILNFQNKCFLGDGGTFLLGYIISYSFIKSYNIDNLFFTDEIVLVMLIPGLELFRLAIQRLLKRRHPFRGDRLHIHHMLISIYGYRKTIIFIQFLIISPILISYFSFSNLSVLLITTTIYFGIFYFLKKKLTKKFVLKN